MHRYLAFFIPILLVGHEVWARAGGAGGGHSSGGGHSYGGGGGGGSYGGGGDADLIFYFIEFLIRSGPIGWIIFIVLVVLAYRYFFSSGRTYQGQEIYVPPSPKPHDLSGLAAEELQSLGQKATTAFITVQQAWSEKRLDLMRRFITDGVYQRFNAQFMMMNLLDQTNPITDVEVTAIDPLKAFHEGRYECVDLRITAIATDQFVCRKFPQLNSPGGREAFAEVWTFIRRDDYKRGADLFNALTCPNCGGPLEGKLVETARCPYCSTYLNSGEYDWVLAEITQDDDYGLSFEKQFGWPAMRASSHQEIVAAYPAFSRTVLEDRASNAFMQILIGTAKRDFETLQRITSPEAFAALKATAPQTHVVYDRLYTRAVETLGIRVEGNRIHAYVGVQYSCHQIVLEAGAPMGGEDTFPSYVAVLVMFRELSPTMAKGSVYAGSCAHCGAPIQDSLLPKCSYCGEILNDPKLDWIVEGLLDAQTYRNQELK